MLQRLQLAFSSSSGLLGVPGQSTYAAGGIRTDFTGGHGSWMVIDVCGIMTHGHYETKEIELWDFKMLGQLQTVKTNAKHGLLWITSSCSTDLSHLSLNMAGNTFVDAVMPSIQWGGRHMK